MKSVICKNHQTTGELSGSRSGSELFFGNLAGEKMSSGGSFRQNRIGRFAFEKYVEFVERAKQMSDPVAIMVLFFLPTHDVFPNINKIATSKHK